MPILTKAPNLEGGNYYFECGVVLGRIAGISYAIVEVVHDCEGADCSTGNLLLMEDHIFLHLLLLNLRKRKLNY